jgi:hypothetical protein
MSFFKWNGGKGAESLMDKGIELIHNLLANTIKLTSCGFRG